MLDKYNCLFLNNSLEIYVHAALNMDVTIVADCTVYFDSPHAIRTFMILFIPFIQAVQKKIVRALGY